MRCKIAVWQDANKSVRQTQRLFNMELGINLVLKRRTIYAIHRKFMKTGSVVDAQRSRRRIESRKIHTVRLAAVELEISRSSIQRILRKDIKEFPYKLKTVHKLKEDNDRRVKMCETLLNHYKSSSSILDNIWFSDEAYFHLPGRVNRHITRIWGRENPKIIEKKQRDSPKLFVWCAISFKGIIGPYFFVLMPEEPQMPRRKLSGNARKVFPPGAEK